MKKKVLIQLEVEFRDLSEEERRDCKESMFLDDGEDQELPTLADYSPRELASVLDSMPGDMFSEFFGGSDIYAKILETTVVKADLVSEND